MDKKKNDGKGTNVGNALRWLAKTGKTIAPEILDLASNIKGLDGLGILADKIRGDENLKSGDKDLLLAEIEKDIAIEQELTKRLQSDNEHTITRLVRPVTYYSMFALFMFMVLFDGNLRDYTINPIYVPVISSLFGTMTIFYFGSRGVEKVVKTWKKNSDNT